MFDVAVDVRRGSPTFGQWAGLLLSSESHRQLLIPSGFAHGFVVTSESALFSYKTSDLYDPSSEHTVRWDDPDLAIPWPMSEPLVSTRDAQGTSLRDMPAERLPTFEKLAR